MPTSGPLTEQEIANGKEIFEALDQDNDGKISTDDLKMALGNAGFQLTDGEVTVSAAERERAYVVLFSDNHHTHPQTTQR